MRVDRDLEKKPRIGEEFQAEIPQLVSQDGLKPDITSVEKSQLVWKPTTGAKVTQRGLESYLALASSCIVPGGSRNEELALEVLHKHSGHVHTALKELLVKQDLEPCWTEQEVNGFYECLVKHQKDFGKISQELRSKSVKEAVAYYYLWKNICREESQSFKHIFSSATAQQRLEQQHHHHQQQYQQQQNDPGEHPTPFVTATIAMTSSHLTNMLMTSPSVSISSVANNNNTMSEGSHITLTT